MIERKMYVLAVVVTLVLGIASTRAQPVQRLTCQGDLMVESLDSAVGDCRFLTKSSIGDAILTICVRGERCLIDAEVQTNEITRLFAVKFDVPDRGFDWRKTPQFRTPSNQIHCMFSGDEKSSEPMGVTCDISQTFTRIPIQPRPKDCEFDWGQMFELGSDSDAGLVCASDSVRSEGSPFLTYGASIKAGKIICMSEETGLTCKNEGGHGFFLSRRSQRIF